MQDNDLACIVNSMAEITEITTSNEVLDDQDTPPDPLEGSLEEQTAFESTDSMFGGGKKQHNRGRPRKDGTLPGLAAPSQATRVPRPKYSTFKSDSTNPNQRVKAAIAWWNGCPGWAKSKMLAYVYRDWPYLLPVPQPENGRRQTDFAYIDKISGEEPLQDEMDVLHKYGCGRYRIIINEDVAVNGESKTLCTLYITGLSNDMRSFPPADPRVTDVNQVDLAHPDNKSYVEFLRMRGLLPEQKSIKEEEQEMATVTAVSEMTGLVGKLIDKQNSTASEGQVASTKAMEVVAEGAKAAIKITQDANEYASKQREASDARQQQHQYQPQAPAENPMSIALEIVKVIQGNNSGNSGDAILSKVIEMQTKAFERMEALIDKAIARPSQQPTPMTERIKDLREMKEMSETLWPRDKEKDDDVVDGVADAAGELGPKWLRPFIPMLVPVVAGLAQAFMAPKQQPMMPQYQPQYQPQPQQMYPPQYQPNPFPSQQMGSVLPPQQVHQPQPMPAAQVPAMPPEVLRLMQMIEIPFLKHIKDPNMTGTDFAGWFIDGFDQTTFDQVVVFGPEALFQSICAYQPIAMDLYNAGMAEVRVRSFIGEFCAPRWEPETPTTTVSTGRVTEMPSGLEEKLEVQPA